MPPIDRYFDEIDVARIQRVKELSEIKYRFSADGAPDPANIRSKAVVVLTYANWEGFYNECVRAYVRFLQERGGKVRDTDWMLLIGAFSPDFEALRARNHSAEAKRQFIADLKARLECGFDVLDISVVEARSNLDYERLAHNFGILDFDVAALQRFRLRLDRELVGWRHGVAHGDPPDLSTLDVSNHVDFAGQLLIIIADCFQNAMLQRP
jgi:RiboL-PSP-HEPN